MNGKIPTQDAGPAQQWPPVGSSHAPQDSYPISDDAAKAIAFRIGAGMTAVIGICLIYFAYQVKFEGMLWSRDRSWTDPDRPAAYFLGMGLILFFFGLRWAMGWRWPWRRK